MSAPRNVRAAKRGHAIRHHIYRLLVTRTQADPILGYKEVWRLLRCPRAPRTIKRYVEEVRRGWRPRER
jgi:hypothetical protein